MKRTNIRKFRVQLGHKIFEGWFLTRLHSRLQSALLGGQSRLTSSFHFRIVEFFVSSNWIRFSVSSASNVQIVLKNCMTMIVNTRILFKHFCGEILRFVYVQKLFETVTKKFVPLWLYILSNLLKRWHFYDEI